MKAGSHAWKLTQTDTGPLTPTSLPRAGLRKQELARLWEHPKGSGPLLPVGLSGSHYLPDSSEPPLLPHLGLEVPSADLTRAEEALPGKTHS